MTGFEKRIFDLEATALPTESQPLPDHFRRDMAKQFKTNLCSKWPVYAILKGFGDNFLDM